jgi:hypothetical protein
MFHSDVPADFSGPLFTYYLTIYSRYGEMRNANKILIDDLKLRNHLV